jgi:2-polyprenyl-6-methoxyphenol hydroxylase-like FAD-dependent oxidoreductase
MNATESRAVIIGDSLGGLFAGILLRSIGWQVDIYERSPHTLDSRGGGVVLHRIWWWLFNGQELPLKLH